MARTKAVSDTGPIIHLNEIDCLDVLKLFDVVIPLEVESEVKNMGILFKVKTQRLTKKEKNRAAMLVRKYGIDLGEATAIALAEHSGIKLFFTDDLDARLVADRFNLEPHGSVGILLRAFREGILTKEEVEKKVTELETGSSLFITHDLVRETIREIERYEKLE
ncbi:MAG: hypothetical protein BME93_04765 [Methanosarcinales archaeon Met12]|nr:MAG: hypothetical protein BME93_04765 [Methanosarcinales archaeon Met12]